MDEKMFCFQCEQTAKCTACTGRAGVCGKSFDVALAQDELTGALGRPALAASLPTSSSLAGSSPASPTSTSPRTPSTPSRRTCVPRRSASLPPLESRLPRTVRSLKSLILFGLRGAAAYAYHARMLGSVSDEAQQAFVDCLATLATESDLNKLLAVSMQVGKLSHDVMGLLDAANTGTYGMPEPTEVSLKIEKGPFIVISGHDLHDLKLLLEQTEGTGVNVYTHGEMLPANAYPELKRYPQLKGNFGTAWQNQQKEFANVPAAPMARRTSPRSSRRPRSLVATTRMCSSRALTAAPRS